MKLAFTGQQTFAQQNIGTLQRTALSEIVLIGDEDLPDVLWLVHQIRMLRTELEVGDIAILIRSALQETERVSAERRNLSYDRRVLRTARLFRYNQALTDSASDCARW